MENLDICPLRCDNNEVKKISLWACSAVGSAPHSHCGGSRFESDQVHETREIRTCFRLEKGSDFSFSSGTTMKAPVDGVKLRYLVIDRKPITRFGGYDYEVR